MITSAAPSILVVEDDPITRKLLAAALRPLGAVIEVADGDAALTVLREHPPHLVCLDLGLPTIGGLQLCEEIRRMPAARATQVLVVSSRAAVSDRAHAAEAGADAFLAKPCDATTLQARASALLARAEAALQRVASAPPPPQQQPANSPVEPAAADSLAQYDAVSKAPFERVKEVARD